MAGEVATETNPVEIDVTAPPGMREALEAAANQKDADGVAVVVEYSPDGNYTLDVKTLGTTRITEADTLLSKARALVRARLGID